MRVFRIAVWMPVAVVEAVVCHIGEVICWMAVWGAGCLAGRMVLARLDSVFSCVAVKGAGTGACLLAMGWV